MLFLFGNKTGYLFNLYVKQGENDNRVTVAITLGELRVIQVTISMHASCMHVPKFTSPVAHTQQHTHSGTHT